MPQWKLVRDFMNPKRDNFYHLADLLEARNLLSAPLSSEAKLVVVKFSAVIFSKMEAVGDSVLDVARR
ncbi:MAG: hypothetical protein M2R45_04448 [Verrucomicrobia subdivision 3 bacterium]|nr:hypothetical protein [Limisphaerales bacterium]MCS1415020.1 hypothetical protein [Limisphaerales bacterium]